MYTAAFLDEWFIIMSDGVLKDVLGLKDPWGHTGIIQFFALTFVLWFMSLALV